MVLYRCMGSTGFSRIRLVNGGVVELTIKDNAIDFNYIDILPVTPTVENDTENQTEAN